MINIDENGILYIDVNNEYEDDLKKYRCNGNHNDIRKNRHGRIEM